MGSQASEGLETLRSFANTLDVEDGVDAFATPEGVVDWFRAHDLAPHGMDGCTDDEAELARRARDGVRALVRATHDADGTPPSPPPETRADAASTTRSGDEPDAALADLDDVVTAVGLRPSFAPDRIDLVTARVRVAGGVGQVLALVHAAMVDGTWQRLKLCANDGCRWAFYDRSRNRSGRWCDMAVCGNRAKVAAFRTRTET